MAILARGINLNEYSAMDESEKQKALDSFMGSVIAPTNEDLKHQLEDLCSQIRAFEDRYRMSSDRMKHALLTGEIESTAEFCSWLMILKTKERVESAYRSSRS